MRHNKISRRIRGALALLLGSLLIGLLPLGSHASADFTTDVHVTYRVNDQSVTNIEQIYTVTNNISSKYLSSIQLSTATDDISNLKVTYADGTTIPTDVVKKEANSQGYNYSYQEITVRFNRANTGRGQRWQFKLSYDTTKLAEAKGPAHTVLIPAIAPSSQDDGYEVVLMVPPSFGIPHTTGATPMSAGLDNGQAVYKFDKSDLSKQAISMVFGDQTVYQLNFNFPLKNDSSLARTYTVALPPDTASQKIYINSIEPKPTGTHLDADGNVLADFNVPGKTSVVVKTDVVGVVKYLEYDLSGSGTKTDIPVDLAKKYTTSTKYWQADNADIVAQAKKATAGKEKVSDIVQALDQLVIDTLTYNNEKIKYNIRQGALKALENPTNAVCLEYSDLMIALLRSQGIPARMPIGYAYSGDLKASPAVSDSLHSWVEAYVPNVGWINVDPTWGEKFDNFGKSDLDHIAFAVWGSDDAKPTAVSVGGVDQGYQYEQTTLAYLKDTPEPSNNGSVVAQKWAILPFVSLLHYSVVAPSNVAGDDYRLKLDADGSVTQIQLGSLAPSQKVSAWSLDFGNGFSKSLNLSFGQTGSASIILATIKITPNYLPMIIALLVLAGLILIFLLKLRRKRKKALLSAPANAPEPTGVAPQSRDTAEILAEISARTAQRQKDNDRQ